MLTWIREGLLWKVKHQGRKRMGSGCTVMKKEELTFLIWAFHQAQLPKPKAQSICYGHPCSPKFPDKIHWAFSLLKLILFVLIFVVWIYLINLYFEYLIKLFVWFKSFMEKPKNMLFICVLVNFFIVGVFYLSVLVKLYLNLFNFVCLQIY